MPRSSGGWRRSRRVCRIADAIVARGANQVRQLRRGVDMDSDGWHSTPVHHHPEITGDHLHERVADDADDSKVVGDRTPSRRIAYAREQW